MSKPTRTRRPLIEAIEPRLLFSATADIAVFDDGSHYIDSLMHAANNLDLTQVYPDLITHPQPSTAAADSVTDTPVALSSATPAEVVTHSLVFVDTHVTNYQTLVQDILNNPDNKNVEIIYIDANQDGIAKISQTLSLFSNVSSIHLISHSVAGELQLGNAVLTEKNIDAFKNQLEGWQKALTSDADILIYGCDLAANDAGIHLMQELNHLTGADVAASTNITGNATPHADWVLEKNIGRIETATLFNASQNITWSGALADVTYINTGSGGSNYALVPGDFAGQSFQYTSGVTIDRFSVEINKTAGAATQNLSLEIRDGYNGTIIGSATVSSSTLTNGVQWVNFDFPETSLNAYQVYWVRLATNGSDSLIAATYHNTDVFGNGTFFNNGGGASWDLSFAVTNAAAANSAPSVTITPTNYSATEQIAINLHGTGISVADADGDNLTITIAATSVNSLVTANVGTTGVGIISGNSSNSLVLNGTLAQLNDFFNGNNSATLTYRIAANTPVATSTLTITASDGFLSSNDTALINITATNDTPVNTVPGTQTINEDTALIFSAANGNKISIADVDAINNPVRTSISVNNGVLSLAGITGLTFISGDGSNDSAMVFTGTITDINAALATLTYNPNTNFNGADTFTIITNDLGNTGAGGPLSDTDSVTINISPVNDAPTISHAIPNQNAPKNVAFNFTFAANVFNDVDAGAVLTYSTQINGGGALPAWLNFNAATRTFSGTPSNADVGTINIDVTANDGNGGIVTDTFAIITSANLDTNYIDTGANNSDLAVSTIQQVGQSFSYSSGNGTYLVNEISLFTVAAGAAPQTVTVELLDAWNGNVLGSISVASADLSQTNKEWYSFDFGNVSLTDGTTYYIKVSSTGTDNNIKLGHWGDVTGGNVLINGLDDTAKDLSFKLSYENGSNIAPAIDNPITNQTINSEAALNFTLPGTTFSDADPLDTLTYKANLVGRSDLDWITFDRATQQFGGTPHFNQIGTWQVEIIATDNHGASTSEFFDIVVANANTVPTPIPDQIISEGGAYNFQFTAFNNANGHALTYTATQANGDPLPTWLNFNGATRTFSGTPDDIDINVSNIKVTASDPFGGSISDNFTLTVNNLQEAPVVINPIANQNATGYIPFNFSFNANVAADPDLGDTLTYSVQLAGGSALPSWLSYDSTTRTFSGTPTNADVGTLAIEVIAKDSANNTVTDTFNLVIATGNTPPVNTVPSAQMTNEDVPLVFSAGNSNQIQITDVDAGSANVQVTMSVTHGGITLANIAGLSFISGDGVSDANMVFTGTVANINNALTTLTYQSASNYFGADTFTITTNDLGNTGAGGAHSDSDTVAITVLSVNDSPSVAIPITDQNATENSVFNFQFPANTFSDADVGDTFTYSSTLNGGGALPSWLNFNAATRTFSGTPTNADVGTLTIDVIANDGHGGTGTETFAIIIANTNDAPTVANAIPDQIAIEDSVFNFQFASNTFNDIDVSDSLTYSSTLNGAGALPAWLNFNAVTRTFNGTPTNADVGTLTIDVTANDSHGGTVTDTFALTITNTNDAPVVANTIQNQHANENAAFNFQLPTNIFSDVDVGDTLTYSARLNGGATLPSWLTFNSGTHSFSGTPTATDVGIINIDVIATDSQGQSIATNFLLTIFNVNQAPTTTGIATLNTTENSAGDSIDLFAAFADREDQDSQLTYSIINNTNSTLVTQTIVDAQTGKLQLHYGENQFGTSQITVRATDTQGASIDTSFNVNVAFVNHLPTASGIKNIEVIQGSMPSTLDLSAVFNDIENGKNLQYSVISNSNPALLDSIQFNQQAHTTTINYNANTIGETTITLRATDSHGGFVDSIFKVTVAQKPITPNLPTENSNATNPPDINSGNTDKPPTNNNSGNTPDNTAGEIIISVGGGKTPAQNIVVIDDGLTHNLIGHTDDANTPSTIVSTQVNPTQDDFDRNRYDRILQQDILAKKPLDTLMTKTLVSSLILPGEGYSHTDTEEFNARLRKIHQDMNDTIEEERQQKALVSGVTLSLTTGILIWSLRASSLLLTLMSMLPLWRGIDPLPILEEVKKRKKDIEQQRKDKLAEDKSAKEVGYLFDNTTIKNPKDNG